MYQSVEYHGYQGQTMPPQVHVTLCVRCKEIISENNHAILMPFTKQGKVLKPVGCQSCCK